MKHIFIFVFGFLMSALLFAADTTPRVVQDPQMQAAKDQIAKKNWSAAVATLDPKHRGAHEYIGVAYVQMGQADKAREHLVALEKICGPRCEEYRDLKRALEAAK